MHIQIMIKILTNTDNTKYKHTCKNNYKNKDKHKHKTKYKNKDKNKDKTGGKTTSGYLNQGNLSRISEQKKKGIAT